MLLVLRVQVLSVSVPYSVPSMEGCERVMPMHETPINISQVAITAGNKVVILLCEKEPKWLKLLLPKRNHNSDMQGWCSGVDDAAQHWPALNCSTAPPKILYSEEHAAA